MNPKKYLEGSLRETYLLDPLTRSSDQAQCRVAVETQKDLERRLERVELREVGRIKEFWV